MTAQMATRLTLRTFKHKKRKVSNIILFSNSLICADNIFTIKTGIRTNVHFEISRYNFLHTIVAVAFFFFFFFFEREVEDPG